MTKTWTGVAVVFVAAVVTTTVVQYRTNARLKEKLSHLENEVVPELTTSPKDSETKTGSRPFSAEPSGNQELFRLRGEVTELRKKVEEMTGTVVAVEAKESLRQRLGGEDFEIVTEPGSPFVPKKYYAKEVWADVGLDSPEATLQTALWAVKSGNVDRLVEAQHWPTNRTEEQRNFVIEKMRREGLGIFPGANDLGIKIEDFHVSLDLPKVDYSVVLDRGAGQPTQRARFSIHNSDGKWRLGRITTEAPQEQHDYFVPR